MGSVIDITSRLPAKQNRQIGPVTAAIRALRAEHEARHPVLEIYDGNRYLGRVGGPGGDIFYAWTREWLLIDRFTSEAEAIAAVRARAVA